MLGEAHGVLEATWSLLVFILRAIEGFVRRGGGKVRFTAKKVCSCRTENRLEGTR